MLISFWIKYLFLGIFVDIYGLGLIPDSYHQTFICSGNLYDHCPTGLCYDSLDVSKNNIISGCANSSICLENGCYYDGKYFTCCCSRPHCNGKSIAFLSSRWRHYLNENTLVRPYPIKFQRRQAGEHHREEVGPLPTTTDIPTIDAQETSQMTTKTPKTVPEIDIQVVEKVIKSEINSLATNLEPIETILKETMATEAFISTSTTPVAETENEKHDDEYNEDEDDEDLPPINVRKTPITTSRIDQTSTTETEKTAVMEKQASPTTTTAATTPETTATFPTTMPQTTERLTETTTMVKETTTTTTTTPPTTTTTTGTTPTSMKTTKTTPKPTTRPAMTTQKSTPRPIIKTTTKRAIVFPETSGPPSYEKRTKLQNQKEKPSRAIPSTTKMPPPPPGAHTATFPWYIIAALGFIVSVIAAIFIYAFFRKCICIGRQHVEEEDSPDDENAVKEVNEAEAQEMTAVDPLLKENGAKNGANGKSPSPRTPSKNPENGV